MTRQVYISVDRRKFDGALQVAIEMHDDKMNGGHGHRIAGPKYDGAGTNLLKHPLNADDAKEIRSYLRMIKKEKR